MSVKKIQNNPDIRITVDERVKILLEYPTGFFFFFPVLEIVGTKNGIMNVSLVVRLPQSIDNCITVSLTLLLNFTLAFLLYFSNYINYIFHPFSLYCFVINSVFCRVISRNRPHNRDIENFFIFRSDYKNQENPSERRALKFYIFRINCIGTYCY